MPDNGWRNKRFVIPDFDKKEPEICTPTRFFDNLSFIGDEIVGCFLLETAKGLVLFDCMNPDDRCVKIIENGILELGYDINNLYAIVISHGHGDHFGKADYFQNKYGAKIFMSEIDYDFASNMPKDMDWQSIHYSQVNFLQDGETLDFGNISVTAVFTPGHSAGCYSFIIPVSDEGIPHKMAMWGGAGIMPSSNVDDYLDSWKKFSKICEIENVDGEIAAHPFLDMTFLRLEMVRSITDGIPNPFVLGKDGYRYYEKNFYELALKYKK